MKKKYRGQWLVIDGKSGKILITGNNLDEVEEQAKKQDIDRPAYYKVPITEAHHVVVK